MKLRDIDLNLLTVFNQLCTDRSVSKVAESLKMSQPAVSNALARLRKLLDDELFLRTSRGMQPTPFALQLASPVAESLATLQEALNERVSFDPKTSERGFRIAMTDIGEIYFLPQLLKELRLFAPHINLSTVRNTAVDVKAEMEAGAIDLAVGWIPQMKGGFYQRRLFKQRYVCLMRKGHALANKRTLGLSEFSQAQHLSVEATGTGHGQVDEQLERAGVVRAVRVRVPHFVAMGHVLSGSDLIATVPEALAERLVAPFALVAKTLPVTLSEITINMFWHAKQHRDPGNKWMRDRLVSLFARS